MSRADVQNAALHRSNLAVDKVAWEVTAMAVSVNGNHASSIMPPVPVVEMRRKSLFSHEMTGQCIATIVTSHKVPLVEVVIVGRAGNPRE